MRLNTKSNEADFINVTFYKEHPVSPRRPFASVFQPDDGDQLISPGRCDISYENNFDLNIIESYEIYRFSRHFVEAFTFIGCSCSSSCSA